ncbi:unnamed protein product [Hydatigera taeniaeformis]|uniref:Uncharacterized protein n=1 Tax=Hydatigena taeniaeformis TaxID=6205 RepID=A0A0R3WY84_HYDTA|nr:unnamed protein product [Hydatigera taeniaeformis]
MRGVDSRPNMRMECPSCFKCFELCVALPPTLPHSVKAMELVGVATDCPPAGRESHRLDIIPRFEHSWHVWDVALQRWWEEQLPVSGRCGCLITRFTVYNSTVRNDVLCRVSPECKAAAAVVRNVSTIGNPRRGVENRACTASLAFCDLIHNAPSTIGLCGAE